MKRYTVIYKLGTLLAIVFLAMVLTIPIGVQADGDDNETNGLKHRVEALEAAVAALEAAFQPVDLTVDCPQESVGAIIDQVAHTTAHVTITIVGVCTEDVVVSRDNITLRGASPGDGLQGPSPQAIVLIIRARNVKLEQLMLTGGSAGLHAVDGASFSAHDLRVVYTGNTGIEVKRNSFGDLHNTSLESTGDRGIVVTSGGTVMMWGGTIDTNTNHGVEASYGGHVGLHDGVVVRNSGSVAIHAREGGSIKVSNGTIEDSSGGVLAISAGFVELDGGLVRNNLGGVGAHGGIVQLSGTRVANNLNHGVTGRVGGTLLFSNLLIENNGSDAISLGGGANAGFGGGTIVRNNTGHGIALGGTSVATFFDDTVQVTGNTGTAVICGTVGSLDDVALIVGEPGTISGNGLDAIQCPRGFP